MEGKNIEGLTRLGGFKYSFYNYIAKGSEIRNLKSRGIVQTFGAPLPGLSASNGRGQICRLLPLLLLLLLLLLPLLSLPNDAILTF